VSLALDGRAYAVTPDENRNGRFRAAVAAFIFQTCMAEVTRTMSALGQKLT
jgi:hypothetical protein